MKIHLDIDTKTDLITVLQKDRVLSWHSIGRAKPLLLAWNIVSLAIHGIWSYSELNEAITKKVKTDYHCLACADWKTRVISIYHYGINQGHLKLDKLTEKQYLAFEKKYAKVE